MSLFCICDEMREPVAQPSILPRLDEYGNINQTPVHSLPASHRVKMSAGPMCDKYGNIIDEPLPAPMLDVDRDADSEILSTIRSFGEDGAEPTCSLRHTGLISCFSVSLDGQKAVSSGCDNTIRIWDLAGHEEIVRYGGQPPCGSIAINNDGSQLLIVLNGSARLIVPNEGMTAVWSTSAAHAAWNADCSNIVTTAGASVQIWNASDNHEEIMTLKHPNMRYFLLCLASCRSADLVAVGGMTASIFLIQPNACEMTEREVGHHIQSLAFSSDGKKLIAGTTDTMVLVLSVDMTAHESDEVSSVIFRVDVPGCMFLSSVALSPCYKRAAVACKLRSDGPDSEWKSCMTCEYDTNTGSMLRQWRCHSQVVYADTSVVLL